MDDDDDAPQPTTRRPSTAHDRPTRTPFGPRIRTRQKHPPETGPPSADTPASPPFSPARTDSPGAEPAVPAIDSAPADAPLFPPTPPPARADAAVQAPSAPPSSSTPAHSPSPSPPPPPTSMPAQPSKSASTPQKSAPTTFIAPPPLTPPPTISFESVPIQWKGLPLEAAQWTFSSAELQEIVSKAIRLSARESFVRLLSLQALEVDIVQESARLEAERVAAQAKWRFEAGRRTMLMQALNACAAFSAPADNNDGGNPVPGFVGQLSSSIASCDSLLSTILAISDQQSQIAVIQHQHWASALGVALRKLNRAHERQAEELKRVQARVQTLEDELEEAWREAEKMAIEFDDLEQEIAESDSEQDLVDVPEEVANPDTRPDLEVKQDDETGTLGDVTIHTDIAVVLGVTATAVASKATLVNSSASPKVIDRSDAKSIRSVKSTRSRRSTRDGQTHLSRLSSARIRSRAASNASLRLPKSLRSTASTHASVDAPPIPAFPPPAIQGDSFLDMDNIQDHRKAIPPQRHPEPTTALPTPPHSAGLPPTRVPSIWLETDGGKSTRLNGLDRTHSLQIFSSLTPRRVRRSNLVMSLTGSDRSSDTGTGSGTGTGTASPVDGPGTSGSGSSVRVGTASPTSNHSPVSLPTHALAHFRGPSVSSSQAGTGRAAPRPGSAGARLTTASEEIKAPSVGSPRRSLMSRASSVILRRLSQATMGGGRTAASNKGVGSPTKSRLSGTRALVERDNEGEGEVMLIGSLHPDPFDGPS